MRIPLMITAVALIAVGCDQQQQERARAERSAGESKDSIQESAQQAKAAIEDEAEAKKQMLEAEAKAAQARIEAEQARAKAQAADASAKVDSATENIREAAGTAGQTTEKETGVSEPSSQPGTEKPSQPGAEPAGDDQKLAEQVRTSLNGAATDPDASASRNIEVSAADGVVTLKGTVKSDIEKQQLEARAKAVPGVNKVENQLEVKAE